MLCALVSESLSKSSEFKIILPALEKLCPLQDSEVWYCLCVDILNFHPNTIVIAALQSPALFSCSATIASQRICIAEVRIFVALLPGCDAYKETKNIKLTRTHLRKRPAIPTKAPQRFDVDVPSFRPYFGNALLCALVL